VGSIFAAGVVNLNCGGSNMMVRWVALLSLLLTVGCGSQIRNVPVANIIMVNAKGQPVDPTGNVACQEDLNGACNGRHSIFRQYQPYSASNDYNAHIDQVINGIEEYKKNNEGRPKRILIYVHGGLNYQVDTVERAAELYQDISKGEAYPIFINWQSSFIPSYRYHLTHVRQGEDWHQGTWSSIGAYITAPFYFAADLARAAVRLPTATFFQIRNDLETVPQLSWLHSADLLLAQQTAFEDLCSRKKRGDSSVANSLEEYVRVLDKRIADCEKVELKGKQDLGDLKISLGLDERTRWEKFEASTKYILTLPTKLVSASVIDALGTSSWDIMLRSVSQLFHYDSRQVSHTGLGLSRTDNQPFTQTGALSVFLQRLTDKVCQGDKGASDATGSRSMECVNKDGWEITLVGHSMGTIIVNRIIRGFGELPIKNVVYMAAATTIKDYQDSIFPYLARKNASSISSNPVAGSGTPETSERCRGDRRIGVCVYHLMLHEAAESGEWISDVLDPFPRGSLLVWLDNFLAHPLSREDRVLGRFTNFILAAHHTPPALRPYINVVKFGVGEGVLSPQKHGEFGGNLEFWKPECWGPPEKNPRNCYHANGHY